MLSASQSGPVFQCHLEHCHNWTIPMTFYTFTVPYHKRKEKGVFIDWVICLDNPRRKGRTRISFRFLTRMEKVIWSFELSMFRHISCSVCFIVCPFFYNSEYLQNQTSYFVTILVNCKYLEPKPMSQSVCKYFWKELNICKVALFFYIYL